MRAWATDERGEVAIEYALIAGILVLGIVLSATNLGQVVRTMFGDVLEGYQKAAQ